MKIVKNSNDLWSLWRDREEWGLRRKNREKYVLICGNCGAKNQRKYLPEKFRCSECGEGSWTDEWEIVNCD